MACIYKATNIINGKIYIGRTIDFDRRVREHKNHAKKDGGNFHKDILKFGFDSFVFEVIEECSVEELDSKEIYYINKFKTEFGEEYLYNICKGGLGGCTHDICGKNNPMYGKHMSEETKKRISEKMRGVKKSDETRKRMSEAMRGKKKSKETVAKRSHIISVQNIYTNEVVQFSSKAEMERTIHCNTLTIVSGKTTREGWKLFKQESVSTNCDECNSVESEISTDSKRKTTEESVEDIVSSNGDIG